MKLSDVMSAAGLSGYAEVGLCLFLAVFVSVAVRTFRGGARTEFDRLGHLPLGGEREAIRSSDQDRGSFDHEH